MSHHEKVICMECSKIISTCKCPSPKTEITYDICEDCKKNFWKEEKGDCNPPK